MANYSLVFGSKFRPFEYQEMLAPVLLATQAHQQLEESYADLATKSSIWDGLTEGSDRAHATYQAYAKALEDEASRLATEGLNPASRRAMLNMRSRYARDITPIENAWKRREEQIAEQRKAGNSMIYDYDAATTSLDKFLDNPSLSYRSIDRKDLRNRSEVAFSKFKEQLRDGLSGFGYDKARKLDKFHNTLIKSYGLSPEQASDFISAVQSGRLSETDAALRAVYNSMYQGTGVDSWGNDAAKQAVMNTILEGVTAGIGKMDASLVEDKQAVLDAELAKQKELARYQHTLSNPDSLGLPKIPGTTVPIDFSDTKLASGSMKSRLATATADYIFGSDSPRMKAIAKEWENKGGKQAAIKHWAEHGLDGNALGVADKLGLRAYIRGNVTQNEDIIDIWGSPYVRTGHRYEQPSRGQIMRAGAMGVMPSMNVVPDADSPSRKDWKDFDKRVGTSYRVNAIRLADDRKAFSDYLSSMMPLLSSNGNVALYDINSISGDGTYTYGKTKMKYDQLPRKSNGEINYDAINRALMSNGDYMYYWDNGDGTTTRKVVQRKDLGREAISDWNNTSQAVKDALALYAEGLIDERSFQEVLARSGKTNLFNSYMDTQNVDVKPYEIK